ncbi:hypothetical protein Kpol_541p31 [Vanderwaltozyma polyspora DSM 70294]|uniref:DNA helicase n=1 Tax=Vanderwaltozyma polyspora (strain ATCC 22028 / DSM 70294 / BCRC 21397 / CBS 2163 / NBRC 10782 / NRRL Y-8283 / UCD 57-17) TaxID=436907 RepID=A7TIX6_VANPO|nr:uncharacterized protein Kpol_541p31 [Vanderwaltozyma polyspora DSM 70294]EDO17788.1 hypothetical protein Kpol_541p31 [Vanderwaltozyma polyspora DSM 70294]
MAKRRYPDRPPNGIGFGETPKLVPRQLNVEKALETLTRPFKVPYRSNTIDPASLKRVTITGRVLRDKTNINKEYKGMEQGDSSKKLKIRRTDALSSARLSQEPERLNGIETILKRSFTVPMKGYVARHNLALTLGTKRKIICEPRPLHDPTDEFAIVLYDPTVDGDMIITDNNINGLQREVEDIKKKSKKNSNKDKGNEEEEEAEIAEKPKLKQKYTHPTMMSNGVRNKPLTELLKDNLTSNEDLEKKFQSIPVVIDPRLAKILRPHQVEGVRFLYRCVTGLIMKDYLDSEAVKKLGLKVEEIKEDQQKNDDNENDDDNIKNAEGVKEKNNGEKIQEEENPIPKTKGKKKKSNSKESKSTTDSTIEIKITNKGAYGCIMADEMGLGKTLQCIALMWTLLKQGPQGKSLIDKCIIVCPSSLVNNWANELIKWLGPGTLSPLAIDGKKSSITNGGNATVAHAIKSWAQAKGRNIVKPVLIISYETLRRNVDQLVNCDVGLMLADEGHRLKNADSLTFTALDSINCPRRIILSGTPIQNDLSEYFALLNFSNPGLLGSRSEFRRNFEIPILAGREADATDEALKKSTLQLQKLSEVVSKFIIRRTNDILSKYLPCKYEHVIFVNMKPFQRDLYKSYIELRKDDSFEKPLKAIGVLKKLCNHPDLLDLESELPEMGDSVSIPDGYVISKNGKSKDVQPQFSGKFAILERFLHKINTESDDKIVLISNYTQTLDLVERLCRRKQYGSVRLDGSMTINKRQKLVDRFNSPDSHEFIFLLSSKAGGCGINLIGANRLILLDPDWNPAADQQALARVWRDGQKKDCFIYRFIATGTIEEKVYQRQSMKMSLSSCVVDAKEDVDRLFTADDLKKLFLLNEKTQCDTHETFNCKRCNKFGKQIIRSKTMLYGDATSWNHLNHAALEKTNDHLLRNEFNYDDVSFAFQYISH